MAFLFLPGFAEEDTLAIGFVARFDWRHENRRLLGVAFWRHVNEYQYFSNTISDLSV